MVSGNVVFSRVEGAALSRALFANIFFEPFPGIHNSRRARKPTGKLAGENLTVELALLAQKEST